MISEESPETDRFRHEPAKLLDHRHELCRMARQIDWNRFETRFGLHDCESNGSPGKPLRLMVGLEYLKRIHNVSDQQVVQRRVEHPYWQYFRGEIYFQHERQG